MYSSMYPPFGVYIVVAVPAVYTFHAIKQHSSPPPPPHPKSREKISVCHNLKSRVHT